ncbi:hypothetical protein EJ110_NYTH48149 [Nymphaea thermarum]|nr:hypothetical protein EJ110_NYTH48149 [Nymphaea thermarum]
MVGEEERERKSYCVFVCGGEEEGERKSYCIFGGYIIYDTSNLLKPHGRDEHLLTDNNEFFYRIE